jgi:VanZ family protein
MNGPDPSPPPAPPEPARPEPPRASPVSRAALLAWLALIVYASWYPFSGWHVSGLSPLAWLSFEPQRYWTRFDTIVNVIGYAPLGTLMVFSLYPRVRGVPAVLLAALGGALISGSMEAVQTILPSLVPSNLDFLTNTLGVIVGATFGAARARSWLDAGRLYRLRARWFAPHASGGLVVIGLWPLAQLYPQSYLFGHGQLLPIFSDWLSSWLERSVDLVTLIRGDTALTAEQYWLSETIITACGLTGAVLSMLCLTRSSAPRAALMAVLVGAALLAKALASAILFTPENAWVWVTPGAQGGFLIGLIMLAGLSFAPLKAQRRLAVLTLVISLLVVNTVPVNPYFVNTLQTWVQGKFLNFNGAAQFLSLMWPFFALWYLMLPSHRLNRQ